MKKKVYIAGPLFSESELEFNRRMNEFLNNLGFNTFLPQEDGHLLSELKEEGFEKENAIQMIFQKDLKEIKDCDILVFIMDGRVPDEGACIEIGLAYAYEKECFGLKTDSRSLMSNMDNPLIIGALKGRIAKSFPELESLLKSFIKDDFITSQSSKSVYRERIIMS
ncbi:MAG: nucleoside 2-deoxyribosyltransferase [Candidatus Methanoperedens sp.]|nr:nucleoside 2-deoxyribosyltransferase [Candidatus Methanoperedens sp.]